MHVPDGLLSPQICIGGYAASFGLGWLSLQQIRRKPDPRSSVPKAALLTAAFFVASLVRIPVPPTSVHLTLNGTMGALLGCYAFPAILTGLFFQAILFGHGGISTLGVNALVMGVPAAISAIVFRLRHRFISSGKTYFVTYLFAFLAGGGGVALSVLLFAALVLSGLPAEVDAAVERNATIAFAVSHTIVVALEGGFSILLVAFLQRVQPELLEDT